MAYQKILDVESVDTDLNGKMYRVYKNGTVVSLASGKIIQQRLSIDGYSCFTAGKKGNRSCYFTHRVVGNLFLEKPADADVVQYELNHIDTNRANPSADNDNIPNTIAFVLVPVHIAFLYIRFGLKYAISSMISVLMLLF